MPSYTWIFLTMICSIFLAAGVVQSMSGFGSSLVTVPMLTVTTTNVQLAIVAATAISTVLALLTVIRNHHHIHWRIAFITIAASLIGIPLGTKILAIASTKALAIAACLTAIFALIAVWRSMRVPTRLITMSVAGIAIGLLGAATGINGPPAVAVYRGLGLTDEALRANLALVFAVVGTVTMIMYIPTGQVTLSLGTMLAVGLPALGLGWFFGAKIAKKMDTARFKRMLLMLLSGAALVAISRVLTV